MQYLLSLMNVLLERMVLASWKLKDNIKYKVCCVVFLLWNGQINQPTDTERETDQLINQQTDGQTDRDRKNKLIFCQIWTRVNLTICKKITKFTKLQLLHYFVIDTHQLVWVAVVEIEAPAVSHEYEVGFLWCFWWPSQSTRQSKAPCRRFPFHHHWKRSSVTLRTFCTICTGLHSAQGFYWAERCMSHAHRLQTGLFTNKINLSKIILFLGKQVSHQCQYLACKQAVMGTAVWAAKPQEPSWWDRQGNWPPRHQLAFPTFPDTWLLSADMSRIELKWDSNSLW